MKRLLLVATLIPAIAKGATFVVPGDEELVRSARAIVVAAAGESHARRNTDGGLETATIIEIRESIKGELAEGERVEVTSLGGFLDGVGLVVPGAPRFSTGERVLLFLDRNGRGDWTPRDLVLGKFTFARDLLLRDESEIFGWDVSGAMHREPTRAAEPFLQFVRDVAAERATRTDYLVASPLKVAADQMVANAASPSSYMIQQEGQAIRWRSFPAPVVFLSNGTQPGATGGGITAAQRGVGVWTSDSNSSIVCQYGGTTTRNSAFRSSDGVNSIQFNDPDEEIPGSFTGSGTLAIGGAWFGSSSHSFAGETFYTIEEADLVVQNGITGPGLAGNGFDHVLAHELGHTLGFRHSDDPPAGGTSTAAALMNSSVNFNADPTGATLQAWDREAASAVYGSGAPPCVPPAITAQPRSVDLISGPVALSVTASGSAPLTYQWYAGSRGDTRAPVGGGTSPVVTVQPSSTTSYWVRVTGPCAPPADSDAATVTVNGCPAIVLSSVTPSTSILEGQSVTLSADASSAGRTLTYRWYEGAFGETSRTAGSGPAIAVVPAITTTYWLQVSSDCGAVATSQVITITVTPCNAPRVVVQPAGGEVVSGSGAILYAAVTGTEPMQFQWYEGALRDASRPVLNATTTSVTTASLFTGATFWLRAVNPCGTVDSELATVSVVSSCSAPRITSQPESRLLGDGTAILTVKATGPSLEYRWYEGTLFDFSRPLAGNGPSVMTPAVARASQFWVHITNPCGSADSSAVTVLAGAGRRRGVGRR